jgi:hypothetical protein
MLQALAQAEVVVVLEETLALMVMVAQAMVLLAVLVFVVKYFFILNHK